MSLWSFLDTHLKVDAVTHHIYLYRVKLIEKISVVPISVAHGVIIIAKTFLQQCLVIHVTLLHAEHICQGICLIYSVTCP